MTSLVSPEPRERPGYDPHGSRHDGALIMEGLVFETECSNKVDIFEHILVHNYLFYESDDATKGDNSSVGEGDQVVRHLLSCDCEAQIQRGSGRIVHLLE